MQHYFLLKFFLKWFLWGTGRGNHHNHPLTYFHHEQISREDYLNNLNCIVFRKVNSIQLNHVYTQAYKIKLIFIKFNLQI